MSNSVFQSVILQLREIPERVFGVMDSEGAVIACSELSLIGQKWTEYVSACGQYFDMLR